MADGGTAARGAWGLVSEVEASPALVPDMLAIWLSPAFPVGAFAFSSGLEQAAHDALVRDAASLSAWLEDLIRLGPLRNDLVLAAEGWRLARAGDRAGLTGLADLALALQPSAERRLETITQGNAFRTTIAAAWPIPTGDPLPADRDIAYPLAVAAAAAGHGVGLRALLTGYAIAAIANLVSAAIRLGVIGQTDGQRVQAGLLAELRRAADWAMASSPEDLGSATFVADLASLRHETLYSRLFRS